MSNLRLRVVHSVYEAKKTPTKGKGPRVARWFDFVTWRRFYEDAKVKPKEKNERVEDPMGRVHQQYSIRTRTQQKLPPTLRTSQDGYTWYFCLFVNCIDLHYAPRSRVLLLMPLLPLHIRDETRGTGSTRS